MSGGGGEGPSMSVSPLMSFSHMFNPSEVPQVQSCREE